MVVKPVFQVNNKKQTILSIVVLLFVIVGSLTLIYKDELPKLFDDNNKIIGKWKSDIAFIEDATSEIINNTSSSGSLMDWTIKNGISGISGKSFIN